MCPVQEGNILSSISSNGIKKNKVHGKINLTEFSVVRTTLNERLLVCNQRRVCNTRHKFRTF